MSFESIISIVGLRHWIRKKGHVKSIYAGKACLNLFRNGQGLKLNFVVTRQNGYRYTFDLPYAALKEIFDVAAKLKPSRNSKVKRSWRVKKW